MRPVLPERAPSAGQKIPPQAAFSALLERLFRLFSDLRPVSENSLSPAKPHYDVRLRTKPEAITSIRRP